MELYRIFAINSTISIDDVNKPDVNGVVSCMENRLHLDKANLGQLMFDVIDFINQDENKQDLYFTVDVIDKGQVGELADHYLTFMEVKIWQGCNKAS